MKNMILVLISLTKSPLKIALSAYPLNKFSENHGEGATMSLESGPKINQGGGIRTGRSGGTNPFRRKRLGE